MSGAEEKDSLENRIKNFVLPLPLNGKEERKQLIKNLIGKWTTAIYRKQDQLTGFV